jgi:hypothetical protein
MYLIGLVFPISSTNSERDDGIIHIIDEFVSRSAPATIIIFNSTFFFTAVTIRLGCSFPVKGTRVLFDCSEGHIHG